jgi:GT2 family glycosyltransferase/glycosyltransferase involved in cell wall biosynthesis
MMMTESSRGTTMRVRVVVLNWNSAELTRRCVRSLLATDYPADSFEIVIVDNGSIDGSVAVLRRLFPEVRIVENGANLGFAEGCNRALRDRAGIDAIALVNNDATVDPGWLRPLVAALEADQEVGAVSPKLLFATDFITVAVDVGGEGERARLVDVRSGGLDLTAKVLSGDGVVHRPHLSVPLLLDREVASTGEFHIPVDADPNDGSPASEVTIRFATTRPVVVTSGGATATATAGTDGLATVTIAPGGLPHRRINNLGTALTEWTEGVERRYGEPDDPMLVPEDVPGWCGGGVLLRSAYLDDVGCFDPRYFAYYEDTDLSWRGRNRGWRTVTAPDSVLHHVHGGSAGSSWPGFFYLNYRNWLFTTLRNGDRRQMLAALAVARRISWPYARHNVIGPLRRLRRPDWAITGRWLRVGVGVARGAVPVLRTRLGRPGASSIGVAATNRVTSWPQPRSRPRPPAPRPGGPVICYVDVTETLRSGWRAGIQRVVTELTTRLALQSDDFELVPLVWSDLDRRYRRLGPNETERLFDPPPMRNHPPAPPAPPSLLKRIVGPATRTPTIKPVKDGIRRRRALATRPSDEADLVLDRFEAGAVFLDLDATWNLVDTPRSELLPSLRAAGVGVVALQHDLLPWTHPDWFDPNLVPVFNDHLQAHAHHANVVVCNSRHTESEFLAFCATSDIAAPPTAVVDFGADARGATPPGKTPGPIGPSVTSLTDTELVDTALLDAFDDRRVLLTVGTLEPRKNQAVLLDAFDRLADEHSDLTLVIVGRQGWKTDALAERLRSHPLHGTRLLWPGSVSDATLEALYRRAHITVIPSFTEGFGLPVLEAIGHGGGVLSSSGGALPEAGGDIAEYFDPTDAEALRQLIERHLVDHEHHAAAVTRARAYVAPRWDTTAVQLADIVSEVARRTR